MTERKRRLSERYKISLIVKETLNCTWQEAYPFINETLEKEGLLTWASIETMKSKLNQSKRDNPEALDPITQELVDKNYDTSNIERMWVKNKLGTVQIKPSKFDYNKFLDQMGEELELHAPKYRKIERKTYTDANLLVLDASDIHIGKLSVETETGKVYDADIAYNQVISGVERILAKAKGFTIDKILFPIGNDILHTDNPFHKTTAGTNQDTSGMWHENFIKAMNLYIKLLETLVTIADVHVVFNPSNHDFQSGFMLAQAVQATFRTSKNITWDIDMRHRKYFRYGKNLIATSHGDGAKEKNVGALMAYEAKEDWGATDHRYIYLHHIHHLRAFDGIGFTVEYMRSTSKSDGWSHRNGYVGVPVGLQAFIHHPEDGRICSLLQNL